MSASRAGRNAEPTSWVCLAWISRSMISPRAIKRRWTSPSMVSISLRSTSSEGGAGGALDMLNNPTRMKARSLSWFETAQGRLLTMRRTCPVNHGPALTKRPLRTSLSLFRGHLSRPACSHVKQLAKQAGDRSDPGRTYVQAGFFYGLIRWRSVGPPLVVGAEMTNVQSIPSPSVHTEERAHEADHPSSLVAAFGADQPLRLDCGIDLSPFQIAYQTYGALNAERSNAIMICHALTLDQHVANAHPLTGKLGWWEIMVGPGRPLDTDSYFIICSNVIGGCMGSTGPASTNPATGKVWGLDFPIITIPDMVRAQAMLLDRLGVETLFCVTGGSMGGMQTLQWTAAYPERVFSALPIACSTRHSAQNIAFHELGRQAVRADPDWRGGRYFEEGTHPHRGLGVARMAGHITYLSDAALHRKFGRRMQDRDLPTFSFDADFQVESYLRYQGSSFVERFDANSYLYLTRAMDYFDLAADYDGVLANAFKGTPTRFCVISFTSDWLFPTSESRAIVHALNAGMARVSFAEIVTDKGHDAFLLDEPELFGIVRGFLDSAGAARGLEAKSP